MDPSSPQLAACRRSLRRPVDRSLRRCPHNSPQAGMGAGPAARRLARALLQDAWPNASGGLACVLHSSSYGCGFDKQAALAELTNPSPRSSGNSSRGVSTQVLVIVRESQLAGSAKLSFCSCCSRMARHVPRCMPLGFAELFGALSHIHGPTPPTPHLVQWWCAPS